MLHYFTKTHGSTQTTVVSIPEQTCHCMPGGVVQGCVVLVLLPVRGVGVQGLLELCWEDMRRSCERLQSEIEAIELVILL